MNLADFDWRQSSFIEVKKIWCYLLTIVSFLCHFEPVHVTPTQRVGCDVNRAEMSSGSFS